MLASMASTARSAEVFEPPDVFAMIRGMSGGRGFMCMGGHGQHASDEQAELRREIRELREEIKQLKATR